MLNGRKRQQMDSVSSKSDANKFIEVFVYDGGKCYFDLSCITTLFLVKEVFFVLTTFPPRQDLFELILRTRILKA